MRVKTSDLKGDPRASLALAPPNEKLLRQILEQLEQVNEHLVALRRSVGAEPDEPLVSPEEKLRIAELVTDRVDVVEGSYKDELRR